MPEPFDLADLGIPDTSEYHKLQQHCADIQPLCYADGETLVQGGALVRDVFLILSGECEVSADGADDAAAPLATIQVQDAASPVFVGEMAYFGGGMRTATVTSVGRTYALQLRAEHLSTIVESFPLFTRILCKQFADRLRHTNDALTEHRNLLNVTSSTQTIAPGDVVFSRGDAAETLYQIAAGDVSRETNGQAEPIERGELFLGFLDPLAYFTDGHYASTVRAVTECTVQGFPKTMKTNVVRRWPELVLHCLGTK